MLIIGIILDNPNKLSRDCWLYNYIFLSELTLHLKPSFKWNIIWQKCYNNDIQKAYGN